MIANPFLVFIPLNKSETMLVNLASGSIDIVSAETAQTLRQGRSSSPDIRKSLAKRGHLIIPKKADCQLGEIAEKFPSTTELSGVIIPTYNCNLACDYCYEERITADRKHMSLEDVDSVFKALQLLVNRFGPLKQVTIMGGEPLLPVCREIVLDILQRCIQMSARAEIVTNGTFLTDMAKDLLLLNVAAVQVTLDGSLLVHDTRRPFRSGKGSFKSIAKGIDLLANSRIEAWIRINIDSRNLDDIPVLAKYIAQRWGKNPNIHPYLYAMSDGGCLGQRYCLAEIEALKTVVALSERYPEIRCLEWRFHGLDIIESLMKNELPQPRWHYCKATRGQFVFDCYGDLYTCWFGIGHPGCKTGRYLPQLKIDEPHLSKWLNRNVQSIPKCRVCKFALICGAGCAFKAIEEHGDIQSPRCVPFQELLDVGVPYLRGGE